VLGAFTIGIFVLPIMIGLIALLATRRGATDGIAGLVSGLGLPLLYIAFLNRDGPGDICTTSARSISCTEETSPWPWLVVGLVLVGAGIFFFVVTTRRRALGTEIKGG
jgi:hypothetical protein